MYRGKILLIDRYENMNKLVSEYLNAYGFEVTCLTSTERLKSIHLTEAHLVLMDWDTVKAGICETMQRLEAAGVPAIILTSENDSEGRLTALEMGAADSVSRPLDMAELYARIRAAQSRTLISSSFANRPPVSFEGLSADIRSYTAELDGQPIEAPPKQIALLYLFLSHPNHVFTREELAKQLCSGGYCSDKTVNVYVSELKKVIGRYAANITTVRGVGYKFIE